jgi:hypothetical protein
MENELHRLIREYNTHRNSFLFFYASATYKPIPDTALNMADYYVICDMLRNVTADVLDFYIQTPGGSGEAVEEIVRFLRNKFPVVNFVVAAEAKSAGTILALSGDDIFMSDTGSLGPIDAQMQIGRMQVSASDYIEWVNEKKAEAIQNNSLSPFDAIMVAQINPGEINGVYHAYKFAEDLVTGWLPKYKFKNWIKTESQGIEVTAQMKEDRSKEIVNFLADHSRWRSHGRSLKREDFNGYLTIKRIDDDPVLADLVDRMLTVSQLLISSTEIFKMMYTCTDKILKTAVPMPQLGGPLPAGMQQAQVARIDHRCLKCQKQHQFYLKFDDNPAIDSDMQRSGLSAFPASGRFKCDNCGTDNDISAVKSNLETQIGRPAVI